MLWNKAPSYIFAALDKVETAKDGESEFKLLLYFELPIVDCTIRIHFND